jgi:hypothetical protein
LVEGREQSACGSFRRMRGVAVDRNSIEEADPFLCTYSFTIILLYLKN